MPQLRPHQLAHVRKTLDEAAVVSRLYEAQERATRAAEERAATTGAPGSATRLKSIALVSPDGRQRVEHTGPHNDQVDAVEALLVDAYRSLDAELEAIGGHREATCANPRPSFLAPATQLCPWVLPCNPDHIRVDASTRVGPIVYRVLIRVVGQLRADGKTWSARAAVRLYAQRDGQSTMWAVRARRQ